MNVQQLVAGYESGAIIAHELVVKCLGMVDPNDPSAILDHLPPRTLPWLGEFLDIYEPGKIRSLHGGAIPTPEQVIAAREWLGAARQRSLLERR